MNVRIDCGEISMLFGSVVQLVIVILWVPCQLCAMRLDTVTAKGMLVVRDVIVASQHFIISAAATLMSVKVHVALDWIETCNCLCVSAHT